MKIASSPPLAIRGALSGSSTNATGTISSLTMSLPPARAGSNVHVLTPAIAASLNEAAADGSTWSTSACATLPLPAMCALT